MTLLRHNLCDSLANLKSCLSDDIIEAYHQFHIKHQLYQTSIILVLSPRILPRNCVLRSRPPPPPWWNDEYQSAVDERKKVTQTYRKFPSPENFNSYKRVRSCSKFLKKQKRLGKNFSHKFSHISSKFCSQFNLKIPTSDVWSLIKHLKKRKLSNGFTFTGRKLQTHLLQAMSSFLFARSLELSQFTKRRR